MRRVLLAALLVVALLAVSAAADTKTKVTNLPGFGTPLENQYTGYVTIDSSHNANLFFWYFESRSSPSSDPLVLWMTGGPGCSSELAVAFENGPYVLDNAEGKLTSNAYSWNRKANLVFIDQPFGTGFSYANDDFVRDEDQVADDMYAFVQQFLKLFPELANRDFYITGESYAGHYVPAVGQRIIANNKQGNAPVINLKGLAIGNGWIDPYLQYPDYIPFALQNDLIDAAQAKRLNTTAEHCQKLIDGKDWTLANIECSTIMSSILQSAGNINIYNIKLPCVGSLCYDFTNQTKYFNRADVQQALNVQRPWSTCSNTVNEMFKTSDRLESFRPDIAFALNNTVRALLYNGKWDLICNWVGGLDTASTIHWAGGVGFNQAQWRPMVVNGQNVGQIKEYQQLSFIGVEAAGHMVPHDQPAAAAAMLEAFISNSPFPGPTSAAVHHHPVLIDQQQ